jgi:hypothetical protein
MTREQDQTISAAYLGICVLRTMCKKAGLVLAEQRAKELLIELDAAFPGLAGRAALREFSDTDTDQRAATALYNETMKDG